MYPSPGVAEKVSVGCVFTGPSSSSEIAGFTSSHTHFQLEGEDPIINSSDHYQQYEVVIRSPRVEFDPVNPHDPTYRTVVIRNFRLVTYVVILTVMYVHTCLFVSSRFCEAIFNVGDLTDVGQDVYTTVDEYQDLVLK